MIQQLSFALVLLNQPVPTNLATHGVCVLCGGSATCLFNTGWLCFSSPQPVCNIKTRNIVLVLNSNQLIFCFSSTCLQRKTSFIALVVNSIQSTYLTSIQQRLVVFSAGYISSNPSIHCGFFVSIRCVCPETSDLQVNCCQESYVYVLSAVRFATVMGCKDCTVVIGAAAGMVSPLCRLRLCPRYDL